MGDFYYWPLWIVPYRVAEPYPACIAGPRRMRMAYY